MERVAPPYLAGRSLADIEKLELSDDPLLVEASEEAPSCLGCNSRTGAVDREAENLSPSSGVGGSKQCRRPLDARLVLDCQVQSELSPVIDLETLDLVEPVDESQGPEHKLTLVAKVEQKGTLSKSDLRDFFREMLLIRRFEEKVEERFRAGELPGFLHVAIGQEAVAVGVCRALEEGDIIASTHRAHGHTLAKGTTPNEVMAELYGKLEGCSHGYGGSMHLYDVERGNIGANAVVGGGLPQIAGAALAFQMRGEPRVAVAFFGDGATNIGTFHEALNLAQLWKVPAVFVLEDNKWAESTPESQHSPIRDLSKRAEAYGMRAVKVDGQDVEAVYKGTKKALDHARSGKGPVLLHCDTYRLVGHYIGDPQVYRSKEEQQEVRERHDPITNLRAALELDDEEFEELDREVTEIVEASVEFAKGGTDPKPEDALKNVYA
jgi:acetoin:2,6-dichlorophenolindophenol oxidoreductase subunit alpha